MSTLYLHIGTPKTGTTAIQYFLLNNRELLKEKGYYYPVMKEKFERISIRRNAHFLIDYKCNKEMDRDVQQQKIQSCYNELFLALDENKNVILSDEAIWHACKKIKNFWGNLLSRTKEKGHNLKVIVYLRRQDEFIQSYWKCKVLANETRSFEEYVKSKKYAFCPLNYYTHLSNISKIVGKDNILVRIYEKEQYKGRAHTIVSDFMDAIGLELTSEYEQTNDEKNISLDYICTEIKRRFNAMPEFEGKNDFLRMFMRTVTEQNKEKVMYQCTSLFTPKEQDRFLKKYAAENSKVAKEFLKREDGILFYAPIVYNDKSKEFSKEEYIAVCGKIILEMGTKNILLEQERKMVVKEFNDYKTKSESVFRKIVSALTPEKIKQTEIWCKLRERN